MRKLAILCLLVVLAVADKPTSGQYKGPSESDVIELPGQQLYDQIFSSEEPWLIQFYADWCGHCKTLRPQWAKLATSLKGQINVAKFDSAKDSFFTKIYPIKGYPTIVFLPQGRKSQKISTVYQGAKLANAIQEWAVEQVKINKGFMVERINSQQDWNEYCVSLNVPVCIVSVLPSLVNSSPQQRSVYLEMLKTSIDNFRDKPISMVWAQAGNHPQFEEQFSMFSGFPVVLLINPARNIFSMMRTSFTEQNLEAWLKDILNRRGGRKFQRYSKQLVFNTIQQEKVVIEEDNVEVEQL